MKVNEFVKLYNTLGQLKNVRMLYEYEPKKGEKAPQKAERRFRGSDLSLINRNIQLLKPEFEVVSKTEKDLRDRLKEYYEDETKKEEIKKTEKELDELFSGEMREDYQLPTLEKFKIEEYDNVEFQPIKVLLEGAAAYEDSSYVDALYEYLMD